jgi:hypothetical protein
MCCQCWAVKGNGHVCNKYITLIHPPIIGLVEHALCKININVDHLRSYCHQFWLNYSTSERLTYNASFPYLFNLHAREQPLVHSPLTPANRCPNLGSGWIGGVNLLKIGRTSVIYLHISAIGFQNLLNIIDLPHIFTQISWKYSDYFLLFYFN